MASGVEEVGAERGAEDLARLVAEVVPGLVAELAATRPGNVYRDALVLLERPLLQHALALTRGNQLRAARLLGLNRNTVRKLCRRLKIVPPAPSPLHRA